MASIFERWFMAGVVLKLNEIKELIMATQAELLQAVADSKADVLAAVDAEKVQVTGKLDVLAAKVAELEAIIAAGGDTQPAIDAVKAAFADVKAQVEGITV